MNGKGFQDNEYAKAALPSILDEQKKLEDIISTYGSVEAYNDEVKALKAKTSPETKKNDVSADTNSIMGGIALNKK